MTNPDVIICGAGMAGAATAYQLCVRQGISNIVLLDERPPLTLTSSRGTQAYRNWWPGPGATMMRFMNRSIDLLEEVALASDNIFGLNRRGYVYFTADSSRIPKMRASAAEISAFGGGAVREHPGTDAYQKSPANGFLEIPDGADLLFDSDLIRSVFPYVAEEMIAATHARRCGWFNAPQLGKWLLKQAQQHGATIIQDRVVGMDAEQGRFRGVQLASGERIDGGSLVIAAGPLLKEVALLLGIDMPVINELHGKITLHDPLHILPHDAPFLICDDPIRLAPFGELPAGVHVRIKGEPDRQQLIVVWAYDAKPSEPIFPPKFDPRFGEILLRGIARLIPGMAVYIGHSDQMVVDGGYYTKTRENRPLIGALPIEGAYVIGALSGYGVMAAQAAGELIGAYVTSGTLPDYAPAFSPDRYSDPAYLALLDGWDVLNGQL